MPLLLRKLSLPLALCMMLSLLILMDRSVVSGWVGSVFGNALPWATLLNNPFSLATPPSGHTASVPGIPSIDRG